jgi:TonB-dependent SusC/RagA subfamily outer membrane receptor
VETQPFAEEPVFIRRVVLATHTVVLGILNASGACVRTPAVSAAQPEADSMVHIGYGEMRRSQVTGAIGSLSREQIERQHAVSMLTLLARIAGVEVIRDAGEPSVRVRAGRGEALIVVDGAQLFPFGSRTLLAMLPSDIERIDVLKGVAATGSYGGRGGNGVIIITTRHGP